MEGQMSIFDFPEYLPEGKSLEEMTIDEAAQIINERCGLCYKPSNFFFRDGEQLYKCRMKKIKFGLSFGRFLSGPHIGKRFLSLDIEKGTDSVGYGDLTIEAAVVHIMKVLETGEID